MGAAEILLEFLWINDNHSFPFSERMCVWLSRLFFFFFNLWRGTNLSQSESLQWVRSQYSAGSNIRCLCLSETMPLCRREFSLYQCLQGCGLCEWTGHDRVWIMSLDDIINLHSQLGTTVVTKEKLQVLKWATEHQAFNQTLYHSRAAFNIHILGTSVMKTHICCLVKRRVF